MEKGVSIVFGTDSGTYNNPHGKQAYEFELLYEYAGMNVTQLLQCATINAARLLKWENKVGCLREGAYADFIGMDESPYNNIKNLENVSFVMKSGQIYKNK